MSKKAYLSVSDQWTNPYAAGGTSEAAQMSRVAAACKAALERNGFAVKVGDNSKEGTYAARVKESNAWGADYHVPLHSDAGASGRGPTVFCHATRTTHPVVQAVYKELNAATPSSGRGVRTATGLYEINATNAVCIYVEVEFHDKPDLAAWIIANVVALGEAIAKGIVTGAGAKWVAPTSLAPAPAYPIGPAAIIKPGPITAGATFTSGAHTLAWQPDGNLVIYTHGKAAWATMTTIGMGRSLAMQGDGNLVIYDGATPLAHTGTHGNPGAFLALQSDGNLVIYTAAGKPVWALFGVPGARQFLRKL